MLNHASTCTSFLCICSLIVSENSDYVHKPVDMQYQDVGTVSLPTFLSLLRQDGLLMFEPRVVDRCCELYKFARYRDGVCFSLSCMCSERSLKLGSRAATLLYIEEVLCWRHNY